jgi:hypothetical protein
MWLPFQRAGTQACPYKDWNDLKQYFLRTEAES